MASAVIRRSLGLPIARVIGAWIVSSVRSHFRTRDIGVSAAFLEEAAFRERRFKRHVITNDSLSVVTSCFECLRCGSGRVTETQCHRPVLEGSVNGRKVGAMSWKVPVCSACDRDLALDVTNPILVRHAKTRDGYRDIPPRLRTFLQAIFLPDPS